MIIIKRCLLSALLVFLVAVNTIQVNATPANRLAFSGYYGRFIKKSMDNCITCHQSNAGKTDPVDLKSFSHNPFGARLKSLGEQLKAAGKPWDIETRLRIVSKEDADGDGFDNETEILLNHNPGFPGDRPSKLDLDRLPSVRRDFAAYLASYRWQPFKSVSKPAVPKVRNTSWIRNPIDAFVSAEHESRGLRPRPEALKSILLKRVYLDLIGLVPTPDEVLAFDNDKSPSAYSKIVDRLLASPRYGERWGRHWMDVWRYSDWAGWGDQVRDSKPHIWRWRDWIVDALNSDKPYDRMVQEMLAADELCPTDTNALRATGFLVRNYKLLSREQWMEDVVGHTAKAFLGITMHCAKCHDHMYEPISQVEYYRMRAIFEPHNVRTLRVPGQGDSNKDGLVHAIDVDSKAATYFYPRGDERNPDKSRILEPGVPECMGGKYVVQPVKLPWEFAQPERRTFEVNEDLAAATAVIAKAEQELATAKLNPKTAADKFAWAQVNLRAAIANYCVLYAVIDVERIERTLGKEADSWKLAAKNAVITQRRLTQAQSELELAAAKVALHDVETKVVANGNAVVTNGKVSMVIVAARTKVMTAELAVASAIKAMEAPASTDFKPRSATTYSIESTGRRLAFAKWITEKRNPLTARIAVNHIWARHFGTGIVPSLSDFGRNGRTATNAKLIDWLASELMNRDWSMKSLHRLIVTSASYRMSSGPDTEMSKLDPDNTYLWRMNSRRLEAEAVRDNVLYVCGSLDTTMGGPELDQNQGLISKRRSLYLRTAAEKEVEFLRVFDGPSVTECYERKQTIMPQQALAMGNSELALREAHILCQILSSNAKQDNVRFVQTAFIRILCRKPTKTEEATCLGFLSDAGGSGVINVGLAAKPGKDKVSNLRENLTLVLLNHHEFVTIR